jgi:hypothetical protein
MKPRVLRGSVGVGDRTWSWVLIAGSAEMWETSGEAVDTSEILEARERVRTAASGGAVEPRVRLLPPASSVLGHDLEAVAVRERYDEVLLRALDRIGVSGGAEMCDYGMPSDYRGWLAWARERARKAPDEVSNEEGAERIRYIAEEIAMGTSAVAFSMREGHAVTPFITSIAIKGLDACLL